MKIKTVVPCSKKTFAAQSAQEGLINVSDLSLLTGVAVPLLTSFAKKGLLRSYAEYHGKRFFNFGEILTWLNEPGLEDEVKRLIRTTVEAELKKADCPYLLKKATSGVELTWKELAAA